MSERATINAHFNARLYIIPSPFLPFHVQTEYSSSFKNVIQDSSTILFSGSVCCFFLFFFFWGGGGIVSINYWYRIIHLRTCTYKRDFTYSWGYITVGTARLLWWRYIGGCYIPPKGYSDESVSHMLFLVLVFVYKNNLYIIFRKLTKYFRFNHKMKTKAYVKKSRASLGKTGLTSENKQ